MGIGKWLSGAALVIGLLAVPARADHATLQITDPNTALVPYPGPYADVDINRTDSTHATITFTSLTSQPTATYYFLMGAVDVADVNINARSFTVGPITGSNPFPNFDTPSIWFNGSGNTSAFGTFNLTLKAFDGYKHSSSFISFIVTNTGGTWANAASVFANNSEGYMAAAHIFVTSNPPDGNSGALATGFSAGGGATNIVTTVPVPTALLSGLGLLGLLAVQRASKVGVNF
jgi:hypothetical protein